jgi:hypothetical protein
MLEDEKKIHFFHMFQAAQIAISIKLARRNMASL